MIPLKAVFVISVLISGLIFSPSYSFAQSNQDDSPLAGLFEFFSQLFSGGDEQSESVIEFQDAVVVQFSSSTPIANAGGNQTVMQFDKVFLNGTSSTDPDGDTILFHWNQTDGPLVDLSDDTSSTPMFNATLHGVLTFLLTVVDTSNLTDTDSVTITVIEKKDDSGNDENLPPITNAGVDQTVMEFAKVTLDGSSSTDTDGNIVSYKWTQFEGATVALSSMSVIMPMFDAPKGEDTLKFLLTITDDDGASDTDEVKITVKDDDDDNDDNDDDNHEKNKVTICHRPPGNPDNSHTITVGESAVLAHVTHGDTLEECDEDEENENKKDNSSKGNQNDNDEDEEKSNSGKNNKDENENKKDNSGKGNSGVNNSGKGNQNDSDEDEEKSNSGKNNKDENENKKDNSGVNNSGKGNQNKDEEKKSNSEINNDDDAKDEDDHDDEEREDKDEKEDDDKNDDD